MKSAEQLNKPIAIAPLITFRVLFGLIMLISILRFVFNGWIQSQYLAPQFFFSYYGFEWIRPPGVFGIYALFFLMAIAALGITLGAFYRISAVVFFLTFSYVELIDKTNYLNHYYFVSLVSLILVFLPANSKFSLDAWKNRVVKATHIPYWCLLVIQVQLALVYFYAGLAKLNHSWLIEALPLRIWLPPHAHLPVIGFLFEKAWLAYFFSWFGAIYDLSVPFLLFYKKTRKYAYFAVIVFHLVTWLLFPIGVFPFIMIISTLVFFSSEKHDHVLQKIMLFVRRISGVDQRKFSPVATYYPKKEQWIKSLFVLFLCVQLLLPWRYLFYPGDLYWTEQGYRFSWRVMLMEKAGYAIFHIKDPQTGHKWEAYARDYLTPAQEKQMATQPDMILQYAQFLEEKYKKKGIADPEIRVEAYVTLNGQGSRPFIDPSVDLTKVKEGFHHKSWIIPYQK